MKLYSASIICTRGFINMHDQVSRYQTYRKESGVSDSIRDPPITLYLKLQFPLPGMKFHMLVYVGVPAQTNTRYKNKQKNREN